MNPIKQGETNPGLAKSMILTSNANGSFSQQSIAPLTVIRRIQNPDGSVSTIRTMIRNQPKSNPTFLPQSGNKVVFSQDGKIFGANPQQIAQPINLSQHQKVQVSQSSEGKIQVCGLHADQQLVQMPNGQLRVFSKPCESDILRSEMKELMQEMKSLKESFCELKNIVEEKVIFLNQTEGDVLPKKEEPDSSCKEVDVLADDNLNSDISAIIVKEEDGEVMKIEHTSDDDEHAPKKLKLEVQDDNDEIQFIQDLKKAF